MFTIIAWFNFILLSTMKCIFLGNYFKMFVSHSTAISILVVIFLYFATIKTLCAGQTTGRFQL